MRSCRSVIAVAAFVALAACMNVDSRPVAGSSPSTKGITVHVSSVLPKNADVTRLLRNQRVPVVGVAAIGENLGSRYASPDGARPSDQDLDIVTEFAVTWRDVWRGQQPPDTIFVRGGSVGADRVNAQSPDFFSEGEDFVVVLARYEPLGVDGLIMADGFLAQDGEALVGEQYRVPTRIRDRAGVFAGRKPSQPSRRVNIDDLRAAAQAAAGS